MINDIKDSLKKNLNDRISSPFYGTFVISWLLWNWKVWYITFFVDAELLLKVQNILKVDYIINIYGWNFYSLSHLIILPIISSYLFVFEFPKITRKFYVKYLDYEYENKSIKLKKEEQFLKEKALKLETEEKVLEKEEEVRIIKTKTQEEIWNKEYQDFKKSKYFQLFNKLKTSLYEHEGRTWLWNNNGGGQQNIVPTDLKAYLDANKIIEFGKDKDRYEIILLTEKGKYFMKEYTEES